MDSFSSVSPSTLLPPSTTTRHHHRGWRGMTLPSSSSAKIRNSAHIYQLSYSRKPCRRRSRSFIQIYSKMNRNNNELEEYEEDDEERRRNNKRDEELEKALRMDGSIPGTSNEFVKQVSSRAYDMRRHLHQTFDTSSYDVLEANPWRENPKPVYVLTHRENQLCSMKTRRNRSEVERELGLLFSRGGKSKTTRSKQPSGSGMKFQMLVEDIREGILVFEDENEAARYCDLLQGGGQGCEGVAEIEASSVFDLCHKMKALAVLFRRGRTPPLPESLKLNLGARKRSLEDHDA